MPIQYILIALIIVFIARLIFKLKSKEIKTTPFYGWLFLWIIAIVVIAMPEITTRLATMVGVGRGVDLVVYFSIVVIFYILFRILMRIEKMEKNLTKVVREDTLKKKD